MHISDFTKDPKQIVLDLVNSNLVPGTPNLTLGQVDIVLDTDDGSKETVAHLVSKTGSGYRGDADFMYSRVALNEIPGFETNVLDTEQETPAGILQEINIRYGLNIQPEDITVNGAPFESIANIDIGFTSHEPVLFRLRAVPSSYIWVSNANISVRALVVELGRAMPVTVLDGLYAPSGQTAGVPAESLFGKQFTIAPTGTALLNAGELTLINSTNTKALSTTRVNIINDAIPLHFNVYDIDEDGEWSSSGSFSVKLITDIAEYKDAEIWVSQTAASDDFARIVLFGRVDGIDLIWFIGRENNSGYSLLGSEEIGSDFFDQKEAISVAFTTGMWQSILISHKGTVLHGAWYGYLRENLYGPDLVGNPGNAVFHTEDGEIHVGNLNGTEFCVYKYVDVGGGTYEFALKNPDGSWNSYFNSQMPQTTYSMSDDNGELISGLTVRSISSVGKHSAYLLADDNGSAVYRHRTLVDGKLKLVTAVDNIDTSLLVGASSNQRVAVNENGTFGAYRTGGTDGKHAQVKFVKNNPAPGSEEYVEGQSLTGQYYPNAASSLRPAGTDLKSSLDNPNPRALQYGESMTISNRGIFIGDSGSNISKDRTGYPSLTGMDLSLFGRGAAEFIPFDSSLISR